MIEMEEFVKGKSFICVGLPPQQTVANATWLTDRGARAYCILTSGHSSSIDTDDYYLDIGTADVDTTEAHRRYIVALESPSALLDAWVEKVDPGRSAFVVGMPALGCSNLSGRPVIDSNVGLLGQIEDKVAVVEHMPDVFPRAQIETVDDLLSKLPAYLVEGRPVVVAEDLSSGFQHEAGGTHLMSSENCQALLSVLSERSVSRVRILPLWRGRPIAVDVMLGDATDFIAAPLEHLTYLSTSPEERVLFLGSASTWLPSTDELKTIQSGVASVVTSLKREFGFRGAATIDGILLQTAFHVTEINARCQGSHQLAAHSYADFNVSLISSLLRVPEVGDSPVRHLSDWYRQNGGRKFFHAWLPMSERQRAEVVIPLTRTSNRFEIMRNSTQGLHGVGLWLGGRMRIALQPASLVGEESNSDLLLRLIGDLMKELPIDLPLMEPIYRSASSLA